MQRGMQLKTLTKLVLVILAAVLITGVFQGTYAPQPPTDTRLSYARYAIDGTSNVLNLPADGEPATHCVRKPKNQGCL